jgi:large subunit ribosomal protein L4
MATEPRTKVFAGILQALGAGDGHERRVLVVAPAKDEMLLRSAANLPSVSVILADSLNVVDLLNADAILIEQPALARMDEVYA